MEALVAALIGGVIVALLTVGMQARLDDSRSDREDSRASTRAHEDVLRENLRFVRDRSSAKKLERPFNDIDLEGLPLNGLNLNGAIFAGANLRDADLSNTQLDGADFSGANLSHAKLEGANLEDAHLNGADLSGANLERASLFRANLSGALLPNAILRDADLRIAPLERIDLSGADLSRADLRYARLDGDFTNANINGAFLNGAILGNMRGLESMQYESLCYDEKTEWPEDFSPKVPPGTCGGMGLPEYRKRLGTKWMHFPLNKTTAQCTSPQR